MSDNFPAFTFTTQEDWYGELTFQDADNGNQALPLTGRTFEMWVTPAAQGAAVVAPVVVLSMTTDGGLVLKEGSTNTLVFRVPKTVATNFAQGEYTADVLEVVGNERYLFMPVRVQYNVPSSLLAYISRFVGVAVTFTARRQPIITPVAIAGRQGARGATIITGTSPPAATVGRDDDYYIEDRTASNLGRRMYGPKAGGTWPNPPWVIQVTGVADVPGLPARLDALQPKQIKTLPGAPSASDVPQGTWAVVQNGDRVTIYANTNGTPFDLLTFNAG